MDTSIFLAKLIGPVFLIMGIAVLINPKRFRQIGIEFVSSEALIFLSGMMTLTVGLAIVDVHNLWIAEWPVILTVFGWLAIVAGVLRIVASSEIKAIGRWMLGKTAYFALPAATMAALGAFLSYQGYLA
jgi:hypothetical protein